LEAGLDHYLTKPLRKPQIYKLLSQYQPEGTAPLAQVDHLASG
jgi:CheY-like chemotaxis protein